MYLKYLHELISWGCWPYDSRYLPTHNKIVGKQNWFRFKCRYIVGYKIEFRYNIPNNIRTSFIRGRIHQIIKRTPFFLTYLRKLVICTSAVTKS